MIERLARERSRSVVDYYYHAATVRAIEHLAGGAPATGSLLEIGCGRGALTEAFADAGWRATGIDVDTSVCAAAASRIQGRDNPRFVRADAHSLPFPDASFDAIISVSVLQYLEWPLVLRECARVLKPGGHAAFVENLHGSPLARGYRAWRRRFWPYRANLRPLAHLRWADRRAFADVFDSVDCRAYNITTLPLLFRYAFQPGSPRAPSPSLLSLFERLTEIDEQLLARWPRSAELAWTAVLLCGKSR